MFACNIREYQINLKINIDKLIGTAPFSTQIFYVGAIKPTHMVDPQRRNLEFDMTVNFKMQMHTKKDSCYKIQNFK